MSFEYNAYEKTKLYTVIIIVNNNNNFHSLV